MIGAALSGLRILFHDHFAAVIVPAGRTSPVRKPHAVTLSTLRHTRDLETKMGSPLTLSAFGMLLLWKWWH